MVTDYDTVKTELLLIDPSETPDREESQVCLGSHNYLFLVGNSVYS